MKTQAVVCQERQRFQGLPRVVVPLHLHNNPYNPRTVERA